MFRSTAAGEVLYFAEIGSYSLFTICWPKEGVLYTSIMASCKYMNPLRLAGKPKSSKSLNSSISALFDKGLESVIYVILITV